MLLYLVDENDGVADNHAAECQYPQDGYEAHCLVQKQHAESNADNPQRCSQQGKQHVFAASELEHE